MSTLYVSNEFQKTLFQDELCGQISDGAWENTKPYNHWIIWGQCEVIVRPEKVGRDFYAVKDNYNFNSAFLLECVGDRMLEYCQQIDKNFTMKDVNRELKELKRIVRIKL